MVAKKKIAKKVPADATLVALANVEKTMARLGKKKRDIGESPFCRFKDIPVGDEEVLSFGVDKVDEASNCGGIPKGRMVEIYGPPSSGKSLLTLFLMGRTQKDGGECALLDIEQSFDAIWAAQHGVDVDRLVYANEFSGAEEALEYANQLARTGAFDLIVIDSTAALTPRSELEGSLDDAARVGEQARILSRACRKIVDSCNKGDTTIVFINQTRMKIGVLYGNPETTPGGEALKFYSHQRLRVSKKSQIKVQEEGEDVVVGQISTVTFVKNKTGRPYGKCEFKIVFDPKSLNPVVMLANRARDEKLIGRYNQAYNIKKGILDVKKMDSGQTDMFNFADWLIKAELVLPLLDAVEEVVGMEDKPINGPIDEAILELRDDPSKIVTPLDNADVEFEVEKVADANAEELGDDAKDEALPKELEKVPSEDESETEN